MTMLNAHYDGKQVVLDEPMPGGIPANARLQVIYTPPADSSALDQIAAMAIDTGLPADYSATFRERLRGERSR